MDDPCEFLEWDSRFFGFRIARVTTTRMTTELLTSILSWCDARKVACLYFLADSGDRNTTWLVHEAGFRLVDLRVTLESDLKGLDLGRDPDSTHAVRPATPADVPVLRAIARQSHHASRFYYDPNFPTAMCDALYDTWIAKSCEGYADAVLVPDLDGRVGGYVSCHLAESGTGRIGLLAVAPEARGKGMGRLLVGAARQWFARQGMRRATVVTQGRNAHAQRLYQSGGFITRSVEEWHHRWREQPVTGGGR